MIFIFFKVVAERAFIVIPIRFRHHLDKPTCFWMGQLRIPFELYAHTVGSNPLISTFHAVIIWLLEPISLIPKVATKRVVAVALETHRR